MTDDTNVERFPRRKRKKIAGAFHADPATVVRLELYRVTHDSPREPTGPSSTVDPPSAVTIEAALVAVPTPDPFPPQFAFEPPKETRYPPPLPANWAPLGPLVSYRTEPAFGGHKTTETSFVTAGLMAQTVALQLEVEIHEIKRAIELVKKVTDNNGKAIGVLYASVAELESIMVAIRRIK